MDSNPSDAETGELDLPKRPRQAGRSRSDVPPLSADEAARARDVAGEREPQTPLQEAPRSHQAPPRATHSTMPPTITQAAMPRGREYTQATTQEPVSARGGPEPPHPTVHETWRPRVDSAITAPTPPSTPPLPTNVYRARRPAVAVLLILPAIAFGFLVVRALAISAFGRPFVTSGVVASGLMLAAIPLLVSGLYGLITGAAHGAEQWGFRVWARPPLAYLLVGLALAAAAGLALG